MIIGLTTLFFCILRSHRSASHILLFLLGMNLAGYYWIPHTLREFGQIPYFPSLILGLCFTVILQPYLWVIIPLKKYSSKVFKSEVEANFFLAAFLVIFELITPQLFPTFAGSTWLAHAPYVYLVPYVGVSLFSFFTYWLSIELAHSLSYKKIHLWPLMSCVLFFSLNFIPLKETKTQDELKVRIVQANIGNFIKLSAESGSGIALENVIKTYETLSLKNLPAQTDLIVWPETAYPHTFRGLNSELDPSFLRIMNESNSDLLIGGYDQKDGTSSFDFFETIYNSSLLLSDKKVKSIYHKNLLLPFGETLPFGPLNRWIAEKIPAISLFAKGSGTPLMRTQRGHTFITPICYEILEPNYMRELLRLQPETDFIINHTNDSWYGKTSEPHQHLFLAKWRAVELQRPVIRSTNTGYSSIFFPNGLESKRIELGHEGTLDIKLPLKEKVTTVFSQYGHLPSLMIILGIALFLLAKRRLKTSFKKIV